MWANRSTRRGGIALGPMLPALCLACGPVHAAIFRVGPAGDYPTVQAGISAAIPGAGGSNEVRVQAGSYSEHVSLVQTTGTLVISGGWNAQFTVRSPNPSATTLNGTASGRVLDVTSSGGMLEISHFLIVGGKVATAGGGLRLRAESVAFARVHDTHLVLNSVQVSGSGSARGGAAELTVLGDAAMQFDHNTVTGNTAVADKAGYGAGVFADLQGASNMLIQHNHFSDNVVTANAPDFGVSSGAGVWISLHSDARVTLTDNVIEGNRLDTPPGFAQASGTAVLMSCSSCDMGLHRNRWSANLGGQNQVDLDLSDSGGINVVAILTNSLIEGGDARGLRAMANLASGQLHLVNLSVARNAERGITADGAVTLSNTLAYANGSNDAQLGMGVQTSHNLIGTDPLFVDPDNGDFHLRGDSPARDAGLANPPGGFGLFDLDNATRVVDAAVDIGAYEIDERVFRNGFE